MSISIYLYKTLFMVSMSIRLSRVSQIGGLKKFPQNIPRCWKLWKKWSWYKLYKTTVTNHSLECFYCFLIVLLLLYYNVHPIKEANIIMHLQGRKEKTIFCQNIYNNSFKRIATFNYYSDRLTNKQN